MYQQIFSYTAIWVPADTAWINLSLLEMDEDDDALDSRPFINSSLANGSFLLPDL